MTSYLFSIIDKKIYWNKVYELIEQNDKNFEFIFVIRENNPEIEDVIKLQHEKSNVFVYTFSPDKSENFMINDAIKKVNGKRLIICRDYFDFAPVMANFLLEMGQQGAQIAMFKKEDKKKTVKEYILNAYRKLTQSLFGYELYQGDIGLIYFGNIALSVLKEIPNSSILTKVNRWKGFDVCYATTKDLAKPKPERKKLKSCITSSIISFFILSLLITALSLLIAYNVIGFVLILLISTIILVNILWFGYSLTRLYTILRVGDLQE